MPDLNALPLPEVYVALAAGGGVRRLLELARDEDLGEVGDITSAARVGERGFLVAGTGTTGLFAWSSDGATLTAMTVPQPVRNPANARIIGIAHTAERVAELAGWRDINCSSPCQSGVFPLAERNP